MSIGDIARITVRGQGLLLVRFCLLSLILFCRQLANSLRDFFALVELEVKEGDSSDLGMLLEVVLEVSARSLEEVERIIFVTLRQNGEHDRRCLEVGWDVNAGNGNKRVPVGLSLDELSGQSLDELLYLFLSEV